MQNFSDSVQKPSQTFQQYYPDASIKVFNLDCAVELPAEFLKCRCLAPEKAPQVILM